MAKYTSNPDYPDDIPVCTGILLTNLGTPDAPTVTAVRRYLAEFLSDPRVIELAKPLWWLILHGIILRTRPRRSAHAYSQVWTDEGSPLLRISNQQTALITENLRERAAEPIHVELAMRYGTPSISSALEKLRAANAQRLIVLPLYPQYSATTTASTFDEIARILKTWRCIPELRMINHYHEDSGYISALVESIRDHWAEFGKAEKLLMSFHGLPKKYILAGDPYEDECQRTACLLAEQLGLEEESWAVSFQSRLGLQEWLKPYTDKVLKKWGKSGIKNVQVICPGFSADCLETLEEVSLQNREFFLQAGGSEFSYIPALNDQTMHINALSDIIVKHSQGWPAFSH
ncbi:MAG: ferrochelatase [Gammaproteobacteria bacterium]|jgi:ferrochelatase